tara:strand:+ start:700 stop:882 length:183 start_codon:yes stop_codon:yes gene_type:complete
MINDQIIGQLEELEEAVKIVGLWQDKAEAKALKDKVIGEFVRIKTLNYRECLVSSIKKDK